MLESVSAVFCPKIFASCAASGSANPPDKISSESYAEYTCLAAEQLRDEKQAGLEDLYKTQTKRRFVDGESNVVLLPGAAGLIDDPSKPTARKKYEVSARIRIRNHGDIACGRARGL